MLRVGSSALLAVLLGVSAALLVSCGSSSTGKLIPVADAGPLKSDFEAVAQAAEEGNGNCSTTRTAVAKTEQDFNELPSTVDAGLRQTLRQGIQNLRARALAVCSQPLVQTTTSTTAKTTSSTHTPTTTPSTPTQTTTTTTPTTPSTPTPTTTSPGGGTVAPGEEPTQGGGTGVGEGAPGEGGAPGAGPGAGGGAGATPGVGQEGAK